MRIFQRDGFSVRFKWECKDRDEWRSVLESVQRLKERRFVSEGKYWEAPWNQDTCKLLFDSGFVPGEIQKAVGRDLAAEARKREDDRRRALEQVRKEKDDRKKAEVRALLAAPYTPPWKEYMVEEGMIPGRRHYQLDSMRFLKYRKGRGLIGDDMGTGKSCQALSWLELNPEMRPAVIVATASTKYQWLAEQRKWMSKGSSPIEILSGATPHKWKPLTDDRIYVINWEILTYWADWLHGLDPKIIVGDECQAIGNLQAKRTRAFQKLARPAHRHVVLMSGTPITSKPLQFYPALNLLWPEKFSHVGPYKERYCGVEKTAFGVTADGATNIEELHLLLREVMIRRTKEEVLTELPPKIRTPVFLGIKTDKDYEALEEKMLSLQGTDIKALKEAIAELSRSAFAVKRQAILDWVEEFLASGEEKLLLFAWHKVVVEALVVAFGRQCVVIDGSTNPKDRPAIVEKFQNDPKVRICVANIVAGGTGIDGLQKVCSNVAFVELTTVPAHIMQAEDRLQRIGQPSSVGCWYLLAAGTIDEDILQVAEERREMLGTLLDGKVPDAQDETQAILERLQKRKGRR